MLVVAGLARAGRRVTSDWIGPHRADTRLGEAVLGWRMVGRGCAGIGFIHTKKFRSLLKLKNHEHIHMIFTRNLNVHKPMILKGF